MAVKALNFKMEESEILAMKEVAEVFHISMTDIVRNGVREYIAELKKDKVMRCHTSKYVIIIEPKWN